MTCTCNNNWVCAVVTAMCLPTCVHVHVFVRLCGVLSGADMLVCMHAGVCCVVAVVVISDAVL